MRFEDPQVLYFLLPAVLVVIFILLRRGKGGRVEYSSIELHRSVRSRLRSWLMGALAVLALASFIFGAAGPQISGKYILLPTVCRDILFLVDQSQSMFDNKFAGGDVVLPGQTEPITQLEAELYIVKELFKARLRMEGQTVYTRFAKTPVLRELFKVRQNTKDRITFMFFADIPTLMYPLTWDREPIIEGLETYEQRGYFTVMGPALLAAVDHLEELGKCGRTLVVVTDGYVSNDQFYTPAQQIELRERIQKLFIQVYWVQLEIEIPQQKRWKELRELTEIHGGAVLPIRDKETLEQAKNTIQKLIGEPRWLPSPKKAYELYPFFYSAGAAFTLLLVIFSEIFILKRR